MLFRLTLLVLCLAFSVPASAEPEQLQDILERIISSYGGEKNLRKLDHMIQEWDFVALMGNRHGSDKRSIRIPDRLKVELTYPDKKETRLLNGESGYVFFNVGRPLVAKTPQRDSMRLQLMRLYSPLALRDRIESLSLTVQEEFVALTLLENGLRVDYLVNKENWHIEKVAGTLNINGGNMRFLTEYSEFAIVDGVLMHHRENKYAGDVNTALLTLRRIVVGAEFDDDTFELSEEPNTRESTEDKSIIAMINPGNRLRQ